MTIVEAVKSGKRFKRPKFIQWIGINDMGYMRDEDIYVVHLRREDFTADDWEIKEEITLDELTKSFFTVFRMADYMHRNPDNYDEIINGILKDLGFKGEEK